MSDIQKPFFVASAGVLHLHLQNLILPKTE